MLSFISSLSPFKYKQYKRSIKSENNSSQQNYNINIIVNNNCCSNKLQSKFLRSGLARIYAIIKPICERASKATYIIESTRTQKKYILKIKEDINYFEEDIYKILLHKNHKNVMRFVSFSQETDYYYFIYEFIEGCNLLEYIKNKGDLSENDIRDIIKQIIDGLYFIHQNHIIHCDLKLENIIINEKKEEKEIQIIDFDLSIICDNEEGYISNSIFGTLNYIAPESYDLCIYSKKSDIWQVGVILYILIAKKFPHDSEITLVNSYSNLCRQNVFKHIDLNVPKEIINKRNFDSSLFTLLENMLNFDETRRYTLDQVMNSEWLKKIDL